MQWPDFKSVLIVEDEFLLSMMMEDIVRGLGAEKVHTFADLGQARESALNEKIDCAILDVMLQGQMSFEIADILEDRGIPFVFSSGMRIDDMQERHRGRPFLSKPFGDSDLATSLQAALSGRRDEPALTPSSEFAHP